MNVKFLVWNNQKYPVLLGLDVLNHVESISVKHMILKTAQEQIPMRGNISSNRVLYVSEDVLEQEIVDAHDFEELEFKPEDLRVGLPAFKDRIYGLFKQCVKLLDGN